MFYGTTKSFRIVLMAMLILSLCAGLAAKQKLNAEAKRYMRSANIYWGQENWDEAAANFEKVLAIQPDYIEALKNMGDLYFYWGETKGLYQKREGEETRFHAAPEVAAENYLKAYDYFNRCIEALAVPENQEKGGKRDEQLEWEADAKNKVQSCRVRLYNIAVNQMNMENYELAQSVAAKVIEMDPEYVGAYTLMANIYMAQNINDQAAEYMKQAAVISQDASLYRNVAALYFESEDYEKAVEWYQKAAEIEPESVDNYYNMAVTYLRMKNNQGAFDAFARVAELEPDNVDAITWASNLASQLDMPEESVKYLKMAIATDATNVDWLATICSKLFSEQKWEDLIEYGELWHAAAPDDPTPLQFLYQAATKLGRTNDAKRYNEMYQSMQ